MLEHNIKINIRDVSKISVITNYLNTLNKKTIKKNLHFNIKIKTHKIFNHTHNLKNTNKTSLKNNLKNTNHYILIYQHSFYLHEIQKIPCIFQIFTCTIVTSKIKFKSQFKSHILKTHKLHITIGKKLFNKNFLIKHEINTTHKFNITYKINRKFFSHKKPKNFTQMTKILFTLLNQYFNKLNLNFPIKNIPKNKFKIIYILKIIFDEKLNKFLKNFLINHNKHNHSINNNKKNHNFFTNTNFKFNQ